MWFTPEDGGLPERLPLTIDFTTGFYFHREGPGLVFGGREQTLEEVAEHGAQRLPVLARAADPVVVVGLLRGQSPTTTRSSARPRSRTASSTRPASPGHGFQQAPAVGEHLAELVAGREPTLDLSPFDAARFERGLARPESFVV